MASKDLQILLEPSNKILTQYDHYLADEPTKGHQPTVITLFKHAIFSQRGQFFDNTIMYDPHQSPKPFSLNHLNWQQKHLIQSSAICWAPHWYKMEILWFTLPNHCTNLLWFGFHSEIKQILLWEHQRNNRWNKHSDLVFITSPGFSLIRYSMSSQIAISSFKV